MSSHLHVVGPGNTRSPMGDRVARSWTQKTIEWFGYSFEWFDGSNGSMGLKWFDTIPYGTFDTFHYADF